MPSMSHRCNVRMLMALSALTLPQGVLKRQYRDPAVSFFRQRSGMQLGFKGAAQINQSPKLTKLQTSKPSMSPGASQHNLAHDSLSCNA